jgi:leader peptidase (prepilin peptidase)/N-methyltransferase
MTAIAFIFGLIFGSFLSVVVSRLEEAGIGLPTPPRRAKRTRRQDNPITGRSRCDHCRKVIPWYDNIPLVSYALLRGKCRHCGRPISHYHPLLELSAGLYLAGAYLLYGLDPQLAVAGVFGLLMLALFVYDSKHQILPNVLTLPAIGLALAVVIAQAILNHTDSTVQLTLLSGSPLNYLIGGAVGGGFFLLMSLVSRGRWVGGGDIKLGLLIGLLTGWPYVVVALILAYLIGSVYAIFLLASHHAKAGTMLPFGPMLVLGFYIAAAYGREIVSWYQGWFL